jgi:hypothetical protein
MYIIHSYKYEWLLYLNKMKIIHQQKYSLIYSKFLTNFGVQYFY